MSRKLYVGNLAYSVSDAQLNSLFETHGKVDSAQVVMNSALGRSRGFGFVEMETEQGADAAIAALNGQEIVGRALTVSQARPKTGSGGPYQG
jgi:RNA recognition motif-containing protein